MEQANEQSNPLEAVIFRAAKVLDCMTCSRPKTRQKLQNTLRKCCQIVAVCNPVSVLQELEKRKLMITMAMSSELRMRPDQFMMEVRNRALKVADEHGALLYVSKPKKGYGTAISRNVSELLQRQADFSSEGLLQAVSQNCVLMALPQLQDDWQQENDQWKPFISSFPEVVQVANCLMKNGYIQVAQDLNEDIIVNYSLPSDNAMEIFKAALSEYKEFYRQKPEDFFKDCRYQRDPRHHDAIIWEVNHKIKMIKKDFRRKMKKEGLQKTISNKLEATRSHGRCLAWDEQNSSDSDVSSEDDTSSYEEVACSDSREDGEQNPILEALKTNESLQYKDFQKIPSGMLIKAIPSLLLLHSMGADRPKTLPDLYRVMQQSCKFVYATFPGQSLLPLSEKGDKPKKEEVKTAKRRYRSREDKTHPFIYVFGKIKKEMPISISPDSVVSASSKFRSIETTKRKFNQLAWKKIERIVRKRNAVPALHGDDDSQCSIASQKVEERLKTIFEGRKVTQELGGMEVGGLAQTSTSSGKTDQKDVPEPMLVGSDDKVLELANTATNKQSAIGTDSVANNQTMISEETSVKQLPNVAVLTQTKLWDVITNWCITVSEIPADDLVQGLEEAGIVSFDAGDIPRYHLDVDNLASLEKGATAMQEKLQNFYKCIPVENKKVRKNARRKR